MMQRNTDRTDICIKQYLLCNVIASKNKTEI